MVSGGPYPTKGTSQTVVMVGGGPHPAKSTSQTVLSWSVVALISQTVSSCSQVMFSLQGCFGYISDDAEPFTDVISYNSCMPGAADCDWSFCNVWGIWVAGTEGGSQALVGEKGTSVRHTARPNKHGANINRALAGRPRCGHFP